MPSIRIRARLEDGAVTVKARIAHPMESGERRHPDTGAPIPAHYIQRVRCEHGGRTVLDALWGTSVSKNPYLSFRFKGGQAGDLLTLSWIDNKNRSDSATATIE